MAAPKKTKKTRKSAARAVTGRTPRRKVKRTAKKTVGKKSTRKSARGKTLRGAKRKSSVGSRARKLAATAAERISPALEKAMESANEAITALRKTAVSAGQAVERSGVAGKPIARVRSLIAESLHRLQPRIRPMKLLLVDVDGVLTDGGLFYIDSGEEMKRFHIHDGMGVELLQRAGIEVGVLTGRRSDVVERRCRELGIRIIKQGFYDKSAGLREILQEEQLSSPQVGYVGDDVQDLAVFKQVGFRAAPLNAAHEVQVEADYVTARSGGNGAVREIAELILTALNKREEAVAKASTPGVTPPPGRESAASF